jgi:DNA-binding response OmpR family regulator
MRVLIIDPDWRFAQQVSKTMESRAHLVVHQADPCLAAAHVERWSPDVVVLAAELAEKGLMEVVTRGERRPAVLLTENLDRYDRAWRIWQMGGDELLMKPVFEADEIRSAIQAARENAVTGRRSTVRAASA